VDVLTSSDRPSSTSPAPGSPETGDQRPQPVEASPEPPRCTAQQVALRVEDLGGSPGLALVHVWAEPCSTVRLPIEVALLDRSRSPVEATVNVQAAFAASTLSPDTALSAPFGYVYLCGEPKPVFAFASAGPYSARGRLPRGFGACLDDLGP
jgi:hypothetical protein